jgi:hypothetical protein
LKIRCRPQVIFEREALLNPKSMDTLSSPIPVKRGVVGACLALMMVLRLLSRCFEAAL